MEAKEVVKDSVFAQLNGINVNGHTEKKKTGSTELTYLSWPWAWAEVKKRFPDATYTIYRDEQNRPYIEDADFGLMCYTTVTIDGMTHDMWLPVMNGANKAMRRTPYKYTVWNSYKKAWEEKVVEAATMFDINKTIMRCLVKNLAMFGLGLYIYAGEDLPETETEGEGEAPTPAKKTTKAAKPAAQAQAPAQMQAVPQGQAQKAQQPAVPQQNLSLEEAKKRIAEATTREQLAGIYNANMHLQSNPDFVSTMKARKDEIVKSNGQAAA
jgi:hypothetical protein